jgi:hypothetical protein
MPLVDSDLQSTWEELYTGGFIRPRKEMILGCNGLPFGKGDHFRLKEALNLQPGQSIGIIGAGFGWVAEDWAASGLGPIVAVDTSAWIHSNKAQHAAVTILNEDGSTNASRGRIRQALGLTGGNRATWCISEDILPLLSDTEVSNLAQRMRLIGTTCAHWVSVFTHPDAQDKRLNWKTLEQWKDLVTPDLVVERYTARILDPVTPDGPARVL